MGWSRDTETVRGRNPAFLPFTTTHRAGDDTEQQAIAAVFGEAATSAPPPSGRPPLAVSSTKGATGHLLGAAGAVEAIFSVLALSSGLAPATANLAAPDPPLLANLVAGKPCQLPQDVPRAVLSNSFGFGGTNAALVFAAAPGAAAGHELPASWCHYLGAANRGLPVM